MASATTQWQASCQDLPSFLIRLPTSATTAAAARRRDLTLECDENAVCEERGEAEMRELLAETVSEDSPATSSLSERRLSSAALSRMSSLSPFAVLGDLQGRGSAFGANSDELQRYSSASADLRREREAVLNSYSPGPAAPSPLKMGPAGPSPLGKRRRASPELEQARAQVARPPPPPLSPQTTTPKPRLGGGSSALFDALPATLAAGGAKRGRPTRCRCDRSRCLKRFCVCFAAGEASVPFRLQVQRLQQRRRQRRGGARGTRAARQGAGARQERLQLPQERLSQALLRVLPGRRHHDQCRCLDCENPAGVRDPGAPPPKELEARLLATSRSYQHTAGPTSTARVYSHELE